MYIKRSKCIWRVVDGETIIIGEDGEWFHVLNEVGTEIWNCADGAMTVEEIILKICREFEVEESTARQDTAEFIRILSEKGVVEFKENVKRE